MNILVVDIGGTHVKVYRTHRAEAIKLDSGPTMTPVKMVRSVREATQGWNYDAVSIGYPGPVVHGKPLQDPPNLGKGWLGFEFHKAFHRPVKVINDAAMQALGSYRGGRMLFLGLGTGLGSALIVQGVLEPMELAHLPYKRGKTFEDYVGNAALKRHGEKKWRNTSSKSFRTCAMRYRPTMLLWAGATPSGFRSCRRKLSSAITATRGWVGCGCGTRLQDLSPGEGRDRHSNSAASRLRVSRQLETTRVRSLAMIL